MAKVINITDKISVEKPVIQIGEDMYEVNDTMGVVLKFQELVSDENNVKIALELALGEEAAKKLDFESMRVSNYKVLITAIMAAMQGLTYEEAASRFQG
ncbi:MAG: hypothetical protein ACQ5SW_09790 [Sphaerochaetaceae bacterium]